MKILKPSILFRSIATLLAVSAATSARAQTNGTWTNLAGGSWPVTTNWAGGTVANGTGAIADFSTLNITANATVTLDGARTVGTLRFQDATTASNDWILNTGTAGPLTLDVASGLASIVVLNRQATINAVLAGNDGIAATGAGTLLLSGANTFTGQFTVGSGTIVAVNNNASLGANGVGNETVVQAGGTLNVTSATGNALNLGPEVIRIAGTGVGGIGAIVNQNVTGITATGQNNALQNVVLTANATFGGTQRFDIRGVGLDLAGFRLTKIGANQVSVVPGTITEGQIDVTGGTFGIEGSTAFRGNGTITLNAGTSLGVWANVAGAQTRPVVLNGGEYRELGNTTVASEVSTPVLLTASSSISAGSGGTAGERLRLFADINESGGQFGFNKVGNNTFVLNGAGNFSGALNINAGGLTLGARGSLATRLITVASGAFLDTSAVGGFTLQSGGTLTAGRAGGGPNDVIGTFTAAPNTTISLTAGNAAHVATFANELSINNTNLAFDLGDVASDQIAVLGNLVAGGVNRVSLRAYGTSQISPGTYSLLTYAGTLTGGLPNFALTNASNFRQTIALVDPATTPGVVQVSVTGSNASLTWAGTVAANTWNINDAANWNGGTEKFFELDAVTFDGTAANPNANLTVDVTPASITVTGAVDQTISGPGRIVGNTGIEKSGAGKLTLASELHTFTGPVNVTGGLISGNRLATGVPNSFGFAGLITLDGGGIEYTGPSSGTGRAISLGAGNGTIAVADRVAQLNLTTAIGGSGGLIKDGPGALRIDANVTFSGNITVAGGVLRPNTNTALQTKIVTVMDGATFDPNGQTGAVATRPTVELSGFGVPGQAAHWNGGAAQTNNSLAITVNLLADASWGSNVRYDLNGPPANGNLNFNGGVNSLTKVGWGETWWAPNAGATVANIIVSGGRFGVQSSLNLGDNSGGTLLIVNQGGELATFSAVTNDKPILLNGGNFMNNDGTTNATWTGGLFVNGASFIGGNANTAGRAITLNHPDFSLGGSTLTKLNLLTLNVDGATNGTGPGNLVVLGGPVNLRAGTVVSGSGVLNIKQGGTVNVDDTGGAVSVTKAIRIEGGLLNTVTGDHTFASVSIGGHGRISNSSAGSTLTVGNLITPARAAGAVFGTTGDIVLTQINGTAPAVGRLGPGYVAGTGNAALLPAVWDGTRVTTLPTDDTNFTAPTATSIELVSTASTLTADTTVDTVVADAAINVNNGATLRLNGGALILRGAANFNVQTTSGARGTLTSGLESGELHVTENVQFGVAGGDSLLRVTLADNTLAGGGFRPVVLVKHGLGSLVSVGFDGTNPFDNTFTGGTVVNSGRIPIESTNALGTGPVVVRDGGQVAFFGLNQAKGSFLANPMSVAGAGAVEPNGTLLGALRLGVGGQPATVVGGNVVLTADARVHNQNANDGAIAGTLSGSSRLEKTGGNTVILSNRANTYTGATQLGARDQGSGGALIVTKLANGGAPSSIGASSSAASNLLINNSTLSYRGAGDSTDRLFTLGENFNVNAIPNTIIEAVGYGSLNFTNPGSLAITTGSYRQLTLAAPASTLGIYLNGGFRENTFAPVLGNPAHGFGQLQKTGHGKWVLTGNHTYGGTTTVTDGVLQVGNGGTTGALGTGNVLIQNQADLVYNRSDSLTVTNKIDGTAAGDTELVQAGTGTLTVGGTSDNSSLRVRVESGTMVLGKASNVNTHAVALAATVNGGTLQLGGTGDDQIFDGGTITTTVFMNGGTFDLNGRNEALSRIEGGGVILNNAEGTLSTLTLGTGATIAGVNNASSLVGLASALKDGAGQLALTKTGTGTINILGEDNNTFTGTTTVAQGTLSLGNGGVDGQLGSGPVVVQAGGTLAVNRSGTVLFTNAITGTGDFAQSGPGATILNAPQGYTGATVVNRGALLVNLEAANDVLPANASLQLRGGHLNIRGGTSGTSSQAINGEFVVAGSDLTVDGALGATTLTLPNAWTRTAGGSIGIRIVPGGTVATGRPNVNGVVGTATAAYATLNGTNWATVSGGNTIVPFAGYAVDAFAPGNHTDYQTSAVLGGPTTTSTVRFNTAAASTLDLGASTLTLEQGGVLVTAGIGAATSITNGTLTGAAAVGSEVLVHQHNETTTEPLTISAVVANNGSNFTTLTKAGQGTLVLTGANTYTGGTHINQGILQIGDGNTTGALGGGIVFNDATLEFNRSDTYSFLNPIAGSGTVIQRGGGILNLTGTNTFTGGILIAAGTVATDGNASLGLGTITLANIDSNSALLLSDQGADISNNIVVMSGIIHGAAIIGSSSSGASPNPAIFSGRIDLRGPVNFRANNADRTTYSGVISGNPGMLNFQPGRTTFENDNTYTATDLIVQAGATLQVGTGNFSNVRSQIPDTANIRLEGNGIFQLNGDSEIIGQLNSTSTTSRVNAIAGGPTVLTIANGGTFNGIFDGGINTGLTLESTGGTLTLGGTADNPTGRVLVNGGTVVLAKTSSASVHAAAVDLTINSGSVRLGGTGGDQIWDGSAGSRTMVVINGGEFDLSGLNEGFSELNGFGGVITNSAAATTSTLTLGTNGWSNTGFDGVIQDGAGTVALTKVGAGGLIFTGANTYTGLTTISGGTLQLGNGGVAGSLASASIVNNGNLVLNRSNTVMVAGTISGTGRVIQNGAGMALLMAANSYTGGTTINAGVLHANSDAALGDAAGRVTINDNATLQVGMTFTSARAIGLGALGGTIDTNGFDLTLDGASSITGTTLTKVGAGTLEISGDQDYDALVATAGVTTLNTALGDGDSTITVAPSGPTAEVEIAEDQVLSGLFIGAGGKVTILSEAAPGPIAALAAPGGDFAAFDAAASVQAVPEPGALSLLAAGVLGLLGRRRRR